MYDSFIMDEDEAALLAELRAISSAGSRFDDYDDDNDEDTIATDRAAAPPRPSPRRPEFDPVSQRRHQADVSELKSEQGGDSFSLMSISSLSHQKQGGGGGGESSVGSNGKQSTAHMETKELKPSSRPEAGTPPWKRKNRVVQSNKNNDVVVPTTAESPPSISQAAVIDRFADADEMTLARPYRSTTKVGGDNRSGPAEDAELLAALRQVSSKSSAANRFDSVPEENNDESAEAPSPTKLSLQNRLERAKRNTGTPPWKRKTKVTETQIDVMVAAPPLRNHETATTTKEEEFKDHNPPAAPPSSTPEPFPKSTFTGERGGAAEDEELLAELRKISSKSSAADRFVQDEQDNTIEETTALTTQPPPASPPATMQVKEKPTLRQTLDSLPPWKRKGARAARSPSQTNVDIVVAAPEKPTGHVPSSSLDQKPSLETQITSHEQGYELKSTGTIPPWKQKRPPQSTSSNDVDVDIAEPQPKFGIKSEFPSTFKGERGGAAEDEELLAELRKISSASSGADRFAGEEDHPASVAVKCAPSAAPLPVKEAPEPKKTDSLPPWKQKRKPKPTSSGVDVVVAAPEPKCDAKSDNPSTSQVERGGAAEDAELLAELRQISKKSGGATRFADENNGVDSKTVEPAPRHLDESIGYGIKSDIPSTFKGERGGTAEDEELLAELREISSRSSADRFAGGEVQATNVQMPQSKPSPLPPSNNNNALPPWKRREKPKQSEPAVEIAVPGQSKAALDGTEGAPTSPVPRRRSGLPPWKRSPRTSPQIEKESVIENKETVPSAPLTAETQRFGIKSDAPSSTFCGERGGTAEDAELLALLRGVSLQSGAADRFADKATPSDKEVVASSAKPGLILQSALLPPVSPSPRQPQQTYVPTTPSTPSAVVNEVTRENLPEALASTNWKLRSNAFVYLKQLLDDSCNGPEMRGLVKGEDILPGLDDRVAGFLEESNANALDKAVGFALKYAELCQGAGSSDRARSIVLALVKKNGLSGKASTSQTASMLALKLMEVGENGNESAHAVIDALVEHGLNSKKVKVVQAASSLMCQAAVDFGASPLPLASMVSCIPKMMSSSNPKVRENGVSLLAELCRSFGSKNPVQQVIDGMRPAQVSELDTLLSKKPKADPPRRRLRGMHGRKSAGSDALAALRDGSKELEAKRFAARPAVSLMEVLPKTEYASKLKLAKWSEKVAALEMVLAAGGEQPYKLSPPSSSNNYAPLISEMRTLLSHTHFAVNSKAMQVLSMLAEGVGEKLFPNLRPLLPKLLELSKDKKLTKAVASCADSMFGNVVAFDHILEQDMLPSLVDDKKNKNALARASVLDFLGRCVARGDEAGPRGSLSLTAMRKVGQLAIDKLADPDAGVRNSATKVLQLMKEKEDETLRAEAENIVESLKSTNARAYKSLSKDSGPATSSTQKLSAIPKQVDSPAKVAGGATTKHSSPPPSTTTAKSKALFDGNASDGTDEPDLSEALSIVSTLRIPSWHSHEDDGGVLAGLKSSKWVQKQGAIKSVISFVESDMETFSPDGAETKVSALLQVIKGHTKGFKESNVNIMKAIFQLFLAICNYHYSTEKALMNWIVDDYVSIALQKISDKKLADLCNEVLTSVCTVAKPSLVLSKASVTIKGARAPAAHEEYMKWCRAFCDDFGVSAIGPALPEVVIVLLTDLASSNPKVRRETISTVKEFYRHLGPKFRALLLSSSKKPAERDGVEKCLESAEFDPSLTTKGPSKHTVASLSEDKSRGGKGSSGDFMALPKYDLFSALPDDCIEKMNSKDGKTSWKLRKEAIDAVDDAMGKCAGLVDSSPAKQLIELIRALRDRLSDTQINLKPLAARAIGSVLGNVDPVAQAKLGKIVYAPLLCAAMNDIKKPMREASLASISKIIRAPEMEGNAVNRDALEGLVTALASEINETAVKSVGLSSVLQFLRSLVGNFPELDDFAASRGESLGEKYACVLIECLISSKAETRSESTSLVKEYVEKGVISSSTFQKASEKLKPAKQRTIKPLLENLTSLTSGSSEKENQPSSVSQDQPREDESEIGSSQHTPRVSSGRPTPGFSRSQAQSRYTRGDPADRSTPGVLNAKANPSGKSQFEGKDDGGDGGTSHPLISRVPIRVPPRPMIWPEFPEEPLGPAILGNLKKSWSTMLPQISTMKLFPATGVKKQDDAREGCELLSSAISFDRSRDGSVVIEQLDYVVKWICIILCSKEAPVGLQALLGLVQNLFVFLVDRKHELNDSECMVLIPFIIEKAANAKGRFRDSFFEIVGILQCHELVPAKVLGPVGCVSVIERSGNAKARASASSLCLECIAVAGLAGIGKKGVIAAAKALSEEHIPENKSAMLDLLEAILERMNGDIQRFVRICGPGFDAKSRELLEERWRKHDHSQAHASARKIPAQRKANLPHVNVQHEPETPESKATVLDELPALSLRDTVFTGKMGQKPTLSLSNLGGSSSCLTGSRGRTALATGETPVSSFHGASVNAPVSAASSLHSEIIRSEDIQENNSEGLGQAALLRQRLIKLKEKTIGSSEEDTSLNSGKTFETPEEEFEDILLVLQGVFDAPTPVSEFSPTMLAAVSAVKKIHGALSQQQVGGEALRFIISSRLPETMEYLTR